MSIRNKIFLPLVVLIFFSVSVCVSGQENSSGVEKQLEGKIGFADFLTIYHSYFRTKQEDERLKEKGLEFQAKIDTEKGRITELEKKMNSGVLSEEEKGNLGREIEDAKVQVTNTIQEFNLEIDGDRRKTIDKLVEELRQKISNFGEEMAYGMILDRNELIFSDEKLDLTKEIVAYINAGVSGETEKPAESEKTTQDTGARKKGRGK